jgi:hypothetical protein
VSRGGGRFHDYQVKHQTSPYSSPSQGEGFIPIVNLDKSILWINIKFKKNILYKLFNIRQEMLYFGFLNDFLKNA